MTTWAGTAEFHRVVATDVSLVCAPNEPLDALSTRVVLNNVNHLCDEFAQVRVNWGDPGGKAGLAYNGGMIFSWLFPITQRQNGNAYKFRLRLGAFVTGGATASLLAVLGAPGVGGPGRGGVHSGGGDNRFLTASLAGSNAWCTGTSQGPLASTVLLSLASSQVVTRTDATTLDFGGAACSVTYPYAQLAIYGTSSDIASHPPVLTAVHLSEYVGR